MTVTTTATLPTTGIITITIGCEIITAAVTITSTVTATVTATVTVTVTATCC